MYVMVGAVDLPNSASLQLHRSTRDDGGGEDALLGTILDVLGDGGPGAAIGERIVRTVQLSEPILDVT